MTSMFVWFVTYQIDDDEVPPHTCILSVHLYKHSPLSLTPSTFVNEIDLALYGLCVCVCVRACVTCGAGRGMLWG